MDLGIILGLILAIGAYMGLLVYYDSILRLRLPPLLVGLKGRVYPLEELISEKVKGYVDPLELESMYSRRDRALGFTSYFITIVSILGATAIVLLAIVGETILVIIPLTILLYIHLYTYKWAKEIEIDYWLREKEGTYLVGISVKARPRTRIWIVNEPPPGEVYGSTKTIGEGYVKLEYYWRPRRSGEYHWRPQLVVVEEANGLLRLDFSKNITYSVVVSGKMRTVKEKKIEDNVEEASRSTLFGTIREPEVIGIREYVVGDRLKDIVVKSILKPGGPRVRKYSELLEGLTSSRGSGSVKVVFVLGRLTLLSRSYRERILTVIDEIGGKPGVKVLVFWDIDGTLYATNREAVAMGLRKGSPISREPAIFGDVDRFFIDPSTTINVSVEKTTIILPYDWRVDVFESYKSAWKRYLGELENAFGYIEKI